MQSAQILSIGRHSTLSGLETNKTPHGWSRAGGMAAGSVELDIYSWIKTGLQDMSRLGNMRRHDVKGRSFTFAQLKSLAACCSEVYGIHYLSSLWKAGSLTTTIQSTYEANNVYVGK
jgi:hypothetical protein